jgi:hypothetical protein
VNDSFLTTMLVAGLAAALWSGAAARAAEPTGLTFDLAARGKTIGNKFSDINVWALDPAWTEGAAGWPKDYFHKNFPFVRRVQLMAATGGNGNRDLFKNPGDRSTLTDYDFGKLLKACENILAQGLKPMVKTGWVPLKFSAQPKMSGDFGTNVRPPDDYGVYYAYIKAMAEALKKRFGPEEVRTWTWGVGVEYENRDWFEAADGTPETTKLAYFRLYDTTAAALEEALGPGQVIMEAHSMSAGRWGLWKMQDFVEHCAKGENLKRGGRGTRLDVMAVSYYTQQPGFDPAAFAGTIDQLRQEARERGLNGTRFGVDEGRVLNGWDDKVLYPREVEHPVQAAGDAKLFHLMVDHDVDYFSTWCLTTEGLSGGLPIASANLRQLTFRLAGSALLEARRAGQPAEAGDDVGGLAGYEAATKTLRVLVYNFNPKRDAGGSEEIGLALVHGRKARSGGLSMRCTLLDEDHGNWWKAWQADVAARKMGPGAFKISSSTLSLPGELAKPADAAFWKSRLAEYAKAARLSATEEQVKPDAQGVISWRARLKANGVALYEISPMEPAEEIKN